MSVDFSRLGIILELHGLPLIEEGGKIFIDSGELKSKEIYGAIIKVMSEIGSINKKGYVNTVDI